MYFYIRSFAVAVSFSFLSRKRIVYTKVKEAYQSSIDAQKKWKINLPEAIFLSLRLPPSFLPVCPNGLFGGRGGGGVKEGMGRGDGRTEVGERRRYRKYSVLWRRFLYYYTTPPLDFYLARYLRFAFLRFLLVAEEPTATPPSASPSASSFSVAPSSTRSG